MNDEKVDFNNILEYVESYGYFQKRFNLVFNFIYFVFVSMPTMSLFLIMSVPDHWCHVPGMNNTNYTVEEWKDLTIPKATTRNNSYETCVMFRNTTGYQSKLSGCEYGYDFDKTWYKSTIPMEQNFVCDKAIHVANAFVVQRMGDLIGSFILGQLGDAFGRLLIFYLTLSIIILGRISLLFFFDSTVAFMIACFFGGIAAAASFQAPLVIAMETSHRKSHAFIAMLQCAGWTFGLCLMPLVMWVTKDWVPFLLITTLPSVVFLFMRRYLVESPRWLLIKGKKAKCLKELRKIAAINNISVGEELDNMVLNGNLNIEKTYGIMSIFSNWRLAKNAAILIFGWSTCNLNYYTLTLSVDNIGGNPFLNFFWQALVELPGYLLGQISCDKIGRKWTNIIGFLGTTIGIIPLIFTANDDSFQWLTLICTVFLKFCVCFSFYALNLQALETYPTNLRQTGTSVNGMSANALCIIGPYILYVGTTGNAAFPYIVLTILSTVCTVCTLFLPETLGERLPESLTDTHTFGVDQPFWYFPRRRTHVAVENK